jgi:ATP-dependent Lon protease
LTRAGSKALTDIVGQMTDPDQNSFIFEDDWLKWKLDLSEMVFIIADNHIEKIDPFLISRSSIV